MSRRGIIRLSRRLPGSNVSSELADLGAIYGADLLSWRVASDATESGGVLTGWADRVGGTALNSIVGAPAYSASVAALGGRPGIGFDGAADAVRQTLDRPAPNVTPTTIIAVVIARSWTAGDSLWGTASNQLALVQTGTTPAVALRNTTVSCSNTNLALNTARLVVAQYRGSALTSLQIGSVLQTDGAAGEGTTDPAATLTWGARTSGGTAASFADCIYAEMAVIQRIITGGELASTQAVKALQYGSGVNA